MENKKESVWKDFLDSIKYYKESKRGKFSLDSYLDVLGEYADRQILAAKKEGLKYIGGTCSVKSEDVLKQFRFRVELFFEDENRNPLKREAERSLPMEKFLSETKDRIGKNNLQFHINDPEGEESCGT